MNGQISTFNVDPGNLVGPENPNNFLTEIRQITPIFVGFSLSQDEYQKLKNVKKIMGMSFIAKLPGSKEEHEGKVFFVDNNVNQATGTILFKGEIPNKERQLWPGEFVTVKLLLKTLPKAILIPSESIQLGQKGEYVFVMKEDSTVEMKQIKISGKWEGYTIVESGLKSGDFVITDGQINLRTGKKVVIDETQTKKEGQA